MQASGMKSAQQCLQASFWGGTAAAAAAAFGSYWSYKLWI
jgi:hypothetical protein